MAERDANLSLICRVGTNFCAFPLEHIGETMRALPIETLPGAPQFVLGLAIIRGEPVPVVDAARLLSWEGTRPAFFVTVRAGKRRVAVGVDRVLGVRPLPDGSLHELPALLRDASTEVVSAIGALDAELLLVLHSARLVPQDLWIGLEGSSS